MNFQLDQLDLGQIAERAGAITAIAGGLLVLWRYLLSPLVKSLKSFRRHSTEISSALPVLVAIRRSWPSVSGHGSLQYYLGLLEKKTTYMKSRRDILLDLMEEPVYEFDVTGQCIFANESLCHLFGMSQKEMLGSGWVGGLAIEDRVPTFEYWHKCMSKKIPYEAEYRVVNQNSGRVYRVRTRALPIKDNAGEAMGYLGIFTSVEEIVVDEGSAI